MRKPLIFNGSFFPAVYALLMLLGVGLPLVLAMEMHWRGEIQSVRNIVNQDDETIPSPSAVLGRFPPENILSRFFTVIAIIPRLFISYGFYTILENESMGQERLRKSRPYRFLRRSALILDLCRLLFGTLLGTLTSTSDHDIHVFSMKLYLVSSTLFKVLMWLGLLLAWHRRRSKHRVSLAVKSISSILCLLIVIGIILPFYRKGTKERGIFSIFAIGSWMYLVLDIAFDVSSALDFRSFYLSLHRLSFVKSTKKWSSSLGGASPISEADMIGSPAHLRQLIERTGRAYSTSALFSAILLDSRVLFGSEIIFGFYMVSIWHELFHNTFSFFVDVEDVCFAGAALLAFFAPFLLVFRSPRRSAIRFSVLWQWVGVLLMNGQTIGLGHFHVLFNFFACIAASLGVCGGLMRISPPQPSSFSISTASTTSSPPSNNNNNNNNNSSSSSSNNNNKNPIDPPIDPPSSSSSSSHPSPPSSPLPLPSTLTPLLSTYLDSSSSNSLSPLDLSRMIKGLRLLWSLALGGVVFVCVRTLFFSLNGLATGYFSTSMFKFFQVVSGLAFLALWCEESNREANVNFQLPLIVILLYRLLRRYFLIGIVVLTRLVRMMLSRNVRLRNLATSSSSSSSSGTHLHIHHHRHTKSHAKSSTQNLDEESGMDSPSDSASAVSSARAHRVFLSSASPPTSDISADEGDSMEEDEADESEENLAPLTMTMNESESEREGPGTPKIHSPHMRGMGNRALVTGVGGAGSSSPPITFMSLGGTVLPSGIVTLELGSSMTSSSPPHHHHPSTNTSRFLLPLLTLPPHWRIGLSLGGWFGLWLSLFSHSSTLARWVDLPPFPSNLVMLMTTTWGLFAPRFVDVRSLKWAIGGLSGLVVFVGFDGILGLFGGCLLGAYTFSVFVPIVLMAISIDEYFPIQSGSGSGSGSAGGGWRKKGTLFSYSRQKGRRSRNPTPDDHHHHRPPTPQKTNRIAIILGISQIVMVIIVFASLWVVGYQFVPFWPSLLRDRPHVPLILATLLTLLGPVRIPGIDYPLSRHTSPDAAECASRSISKARHLTLSPPTHLKPSIRALLILLALLMSLHFLYRATLPRPKPYFSPNIHNPHSRPTFRTGVWGTKFFYGTNHALSVQKSMTMLLQQRVDLLALVETDMSRPFMGNYDMVEYLSHSMGMYSSYGPSTRNATWGCALLSKHPLIRNTVFTLPSPEGEKACAIDAAVEVFGKRVNVLVAHFGNEVNELDRKLQAIALSKIARGYYPEPTIILAYLTSSPHTKNYDFVTKTGLMQDIDPYIQDRWCLYQLYRFLKPVGFSRILNHGASDTELQVAIWESHVQPEWWSYLDRLFRPPEKRVIIDRGVDLDEDEEIGENVVMTHSTTTTTTTTTGSTDSGSSTPPKTTTTTPTTTPTNTNHLGYSVDDCRQWKEYVDPAKSCAIPSHRWHRSELISPPKTHLFPKNVHRGSYAVQEYFTQKFD